MINPYLKAVIPALLTVIASLAVVYGHYPWYTPVATGITALLTYLVPNTPNAPKVIPNTPNTPKVINPYNKENPNGS